LDIYGDNIKTIGLFDKSDSLIGSFNIYIGNKLGQSYIITPPYSTDIGLWYEDLTETTFQKNKLRKNIVECVVQYLKNQKVLFTEIVLPISVTDIQPFQWSNFETSVKYTYLVDLNQSEETLLQNMSPERRKNIKDGIKNIEVEKCKDYSFTLEKIILSLEANDAKFNSDIVNKIILQFPQNDNHICYNTFTNNELTSTHFIVKDGGSANYLFGWSDKKASSSAGTFGLWNCMLEAKALGVKTFNFAGSGIPSIEKYFRGFGGILTPAFSVKRQSVLGKTILKLKK